MMPTPGRIVLYTLGVSDVEQIKQRRLLKILHGNDVRAGDVYPAVVVRVFGGTCCNLQVLLDGEDTHWATSRSNADSDYAHPDGQGCWRWPDRPAPVTPTVTQTIVGGLGTATAAAVEALGHDLRRRA